MTISSAQALAWRLDRQHLRTGAASAVDVVRRLGAVPAWSGDAELAVRRRLADPVPGAVAAAVRSGALLRTFAFRGSSHLMAAEDAGVHLALRAAGRQWALRSWQEHDDLCPEDWPPLLDAVRSALADGPLTREAFAAAVTAGPPVPGVGPGPAGGAPRGGRTARRAARPHSRGAGEHGVTGSRGPARMGTRPTAVDRRRGRGGPP